MDAPTSFSLGDKKFNHELVEKEILMSNLKLGVDGENIPNVHTM